MEINLLSHCGNDEDSDFEISFTIQHYKFYVKLHITKTDEEEWKDLKVAAETPGSVYFVVNDPDTDNVFGISEDELVIKVNDELCELKYYIPLSEENNRKLLVEFINIVLESVDRSLVCSRSSCTSFSDTSDSSFSDSDCENSSSLDDVIEDIVVIEDFPHQETETDSSTVGKCLIV